MWQIEEHRRVDKRFAGSVPVEVLKIKGFHDEALSGAWTGHRSSRLGLQWRVIYRVAADVLLIQVVDVNAHDYRKLEMNLRTAFQPQWPGGNAPYLLAWLRLFVPGGRNLG